VLHRLAHLAVMNAFAALRSPMADRDEDAEILAEADSEIVRAPGSAGIAGATQRLAAALSEGDRLTVILVPFSGRRWLAHVRGGTTVSAYDIDDPEIRWGSEPNLIPGGVVYTLGERPGPGPENIPGVYVGRCTGLC
jgi:hypothetical protein